MNIDTITICSKFRRINWWGISQGFTTFTGFGDEMAQFMFRLAHFIEQI